MTKILKILKLSVLGVLIVFAFSSCATIMNRKTYTLKVSTNNSEAHIVYDETEYSSPAKIKVTRSEDDLHIALLVDSMKKDFIVKSRLNKQFWFGNPLVLYMFFAPVGWGVDLTNPRRFTYGNDLFLDYYDTNSIIRPKITPKLNHFLTRQYPARQGQINVVFSYPQVNSCYFKPQNEPLKAWEGYLGIGMGVEYFYTNTKYFQIKADATINFPIWVPMPVSIHEEGDIEDLNSWYVSITDNWKIRRFTFGYGVNYAENTWKFFPGTEYDEFGNLIPKRDYTRKTNETLGLTFNSYYQLLNWLHLGVVYRPSIYQLSPQRGLTYEHIISLDILFKIRLLSGK